MSSKRKSDVGEGRGKKKSKKEESEPEDFDDENDSMSDASNKQDEADDKSDEPAQEFLPNSEASEKLVSNIFIFGRIRLGQCHSDPVIISSFVCYALLH